MTGAVERVHGHSVRVGRGARGTSQKLDKLPKCASAIREPHRSLRTRRTIQIYSEGAGETFIGILTQDHEGTSQSASEGRYAQRRSVQFAGWCRESH